MLRKEAGILLNFDKARPGRFWETTQLYDNVAGAWNGLTQEQQRNVYARGPYQSIALTENWRLQTWIDQAVEYAPYNQPDLLINKLATKPSQVGHESRTLEASFWELTGVRIRGRGAGYVVGLRDFLDNTELLIQITQVLLGRISEFIACET